VGCARSLAVRRVSEADALGIVAPLLAQPTWTPSLVFEAGVHSVRYDYSGEIRFGPPLYTATVDGPVSSAVSANLGNFPVFPLGRPTKRNTSGMQSLNGMEI
jgi:hypothetical protein